MPWKKASFKGKDVWIEVGAGGDPVEKTGRVGMRYSDKQGARIYRASVGNVSLGSSAPVELPAGESADAVKPAKRSPRKGGGGSGFGKAGTRTAAQAKAAAEDAAARLTALPEGTHIFYTDGGCRGNPGPAGSGVFATLADGRTAEVSRSLGRGTNNIAELTAIGIALDLCEEAGLPGDAPVAVFSDSSYANGVLTKGWKAKKNVDLIVGIRAKLKTRPGVTVYWVAGHAGVEGNERADQLATEGVSGKNSKRWA